MLHSEISRHKQTPLILRITWRAYYLIQKIVPPERLLKILLNSVWALWRLSWEQTNVYENRQSTPGKIDILRPRNVSDAIEGMSGGMRVCDFGGGAGDISSALLVHGCKVVYCDTNQKLEANILERFRGNSDFSVADSFRVLQGLEGKFDLIIMSHVLEHIEEPQKFLETLSKTTKRIHIEVPDLAAEPLSYIRIKLGLPVYKDDDHIVEMSLEYLQKLVESAKFTVEKIVSRDACLVVRAISKNE